jgi:hypothetical protein
VNTWQCRLLLLASMAASCSRTTAKMPSAIPDMDVLREAISATGAVFDKESREDLDSAMAYAIAGRHHLVPILEQCMVGLFWFSVTWTPFCYAKQMAEGGRDGRAAQAVDAG